MPKKTKEDYPELIEYDIKDKKTGENLIGYKYVCEYSNQKKVREDIVNEVDPTRLVLKSLCKTMGDFSQILLVNHLSQEYPNKLYLLFTIDIMASYISSIFNYGTI